MAPKANVLILNALAVLLVLAAAGRAFDMSLSEDSFSIPAGETNSVIVTVTSPINDQLIVSAGGEKPWMMIPTHVTVQANVSTTTRIIFSPYITTEARLYKISLSMESFETAEKQSKNISVAVRSTEVAIEKLVLSGSIEPTGYAELEILLKNYDNVSRDVRLDLAAGPTDLLGTSDIVTLAPKEFTIVKKGFSIPACQPAGSYYVTAKVFSRGIQVFYAEDNFTIPQKSIISQLKNETSSGLRSYTIITVRNSGNTETTTEVSEDIFGSLFFSGTDPTRIQDSAYTWVLTVPSCSSRTISYSFDYTPIPVIIVVIFALWYIFFRIRTVRFTKRILQKKTIEKGTEFTVGVDMKAYSPVGDIEVRDFVPLLFDVLDAPGIKPIRNKTNIGTELIWRFKDFRRGEDRVLSYKIVPLFGVAGKIVLPRATISFRYLGRKVGKRSGKTWLGLKMPEAAEHVLNHTADMAEKIKHSFKSVLKRKPREPEEQEEEESKESRKG